MDDDDNETPRLTCLCGHKGPKRDFSLVIEHGTRLCRPCGEYREYEADMQEGLNDD